MPPPYTPVAPKSAHDCCFLLGFSLHLPGNRFGDHVGRLRLQSSVLSSNSCSYYGPASWLALLSRAFTFELARGLGHPEANVEYDYVGKQSIPTTGLPPASPTALWAAAPAPTPLSRRLGRSPSSGYVPTLERHREEQDQDDQEDHTETHGLPLSVV